MGKILIILALIITAIGLFSGPAAQIEWTMYLGLPLVIFGGAIGVTFITKRLEAIVLGMVIAALWPVLVEALQLV